MLTDKQLKLDDKQTIEERILHVKLERKIAGSLVPTEWPFYVVICDSYTYCNIH